MIQSMTGYGKSTAVVKGKKIHVEIKSLNSKALDLSARIVPLYREKEMEIRAMISQTLERGKVDFTIWVEKDDTQTATPINGVILDNYYQQIKQISEERHIPLPADWFATLLRLPDVMTRTEVEELDEEEWNAVRTAIKEAIGKLVDFRKQEGAALQKKFTEKIQNIGDLLKSIEPYEQSRTERIRQRLVETLETIPNVEYDKNRLEQEMIYYIEKLDINEEKQRLANHLKYFVETMENGHGQGKKLGFIAQEMGREINTTDQRASAQRNVTILTKMTGKLIIFSAPSGSGKSTLINYLMGQDLNLAFSISATSRPPRGTERDGVEYFFLTPEEFRQRISNGEFLEYEEVYKDRFYGTLKAQVEKQLEAGQNVVFDVDVHGGCRIKEFYGDRALSMFIQPPSVEELRRRLENRGTDTPEVIDDRIARAEYELTFAPKFDTIVVNDDLEKAKAEALARLKAFLHP